MRVTHGLLAGSPRRRQDSRAILGVGLQGDLAPIGLPAVPEELLVGVSAGRGVAPRRAWPPRA
ncbi:MAG: hypothetical protein MZV63_22200 [Marinilabiliales bacterium]|nr:hypothetical protein [Marinilabiliales bacterium]